MIFEPVVKIPTLYILPANHNAKTTKTIKRKIDKINCQSGTPKGSLAIIRIGEVKGNKLKNKDNAVIVITHYQRLLDYIIPDYVHVLHEGKIVKSGDKNLAHQLEEKGYDWIK